MCLPQSFLPYQRTCSLIEVWSRKPPLALPVFALDLQSQLAMETVIKNLNVQITVFKLRPKTLSCSVLPSVGEIVTTTGLVHLPYMTAGLINSLRRERMVCVA